MSENFTNLEIDLKIQNQEANSSLHNFYPKQYSTTYIIIKLSQIKDEGRILIAARRKKFLIQQNPHKAMSGFICRPGENGLIYSKC